MKSGNKGNQHHWTPENAGSTAVQGAYNVWYRMPRELALLSVYTVMRELTDKPGVVESVHPYSYSVHCSAGQLSGASPPPNGHSYMTVKGDI